MYKVAKLVKKVNIFSDNGQFIHAHKISIDRAIKNDTSVEDIVIAWFDKIQNPALFDYCSKVQFAVSNKTPPEITGFTQDTTEDVPDTNLYESNQTLGAAVLKQFIEENASVISVVDFSETSTCGYQFSSIVKPSGLSSDNSNIRIAIIPLTSIENSAGLSIFAWTIKSDVQPTGNTAEIVAVS